MESPLAGEEEGTEVPQEWSYRAVIGCTDGAKLWCKGCSMEGL